MSIMIKYRVHEVAKDLGVASKDVIALLNDFLGEQKKHMTALTDDELNIVLTTEVECKDKKLYSNGNVELYGCTVEDSKIKYNYVNGKVVRLK